MTKAELIQAIDVRLALAAYKGGIGKTTIEAVLTALGEVAHRTLPYGGEVPLPGIGKLKGKARQARPGRNPRTGAAIHIPGRMGVSFEAGKALTEALKAVTK
ncbi:HU family DNA-binding protein [Solidesulfovibrio sp.]